MTPTLLSLLACIDGTDTGDTGDTSTDDTATTAPVSLNEPLSSASTASWGCQWAYMADQHADASLVARIVLPEVDRHANTDVSYTAELGAEDSLEVADGPGLGEISFFDCSDVIETWSDAHVWTATAASYTLSATFVAEHPEWTCDGTSPNPVYDAALTIVDATFEDGAGGVATLTDWGPLAVQIGFDYCGG